MLLPNLLAVQQIENHSPYHHYNAFAPKPFTTSSRTARTDMRHVTCSRYCVAIHALRSSISRLSGYVEKHCATARAPARFVNCNRTRNANCFATKVGMSAVAVGLEKGSPSYNIPGVADVSYRGTDMYGFSHGCSCVLELASRSLVLSAGSAPVNLFQWDVDSGSKLLH